MTTDLTLDLVQSQLKPQQRLIIDQGTLNEIQHLAEDPDYGPEFLDCYLDHLNILKENPRRNHAQYLIAVKFFSLVQAGNSLTDAYIKVFPHRYNDRKRNHQDTEDGDKSFMRGEASRYNSTMLVNEIRKIAAIPVQLIHRHLLHEAILVTADLMENGKSDFVKQKAAEVLIRELKPSEDTVLEVNVNDGAKSVIEELSRVTKELAAEQYKKVVAGVPLRELSAAKLLEKPAEDEIEEGEFTEGRVANE